MTGFVCLVLFSIATVVLPPISGLRPLKTGLWSSNLENIPVDQIERHARDADFTFDDLVNPCRQYFQCLMPADSEPFLNKFVNFYMEQATQILSNVCPSVVKDPANCDRRRCSDFHLRTNFYAMSQIKYRFLNWSCEYLNAFQAGRACWSPPFRADMLTCLRIHDNPGYSSPDISLMLNCFDDKAWELNACHATDAMFVHLMNRRILQIWTEVFENVNENRKK